MASSKQTSYRLCCGEATSEWIAGRLRWNPVVRGWIYPAPQTVFPLFQWAFCPNCGADLPPFEPTMPWNPADEQADGN